MTGYDAAEQAYKAGYERGYEYGRDSRIAERGETCILMAISAGNANSFMLNKRRAYTVKYDALLGRWIVHSEEVTNGDAVCGIGKTEDI